MQHLKLARRVERRQRQLRKRIGRGADPEHAPRTQLGHAGEQRVVGRQHVARRRDLQRQHAVGLHVGLHGDEQALLAARRNRQLADRHQLVVQPHFQLRRGGLAGGGMDLDERLETAQLQRQPPQFEGGDAHVDRFGQGQADVLDRDVVGRRRSLARRPVRRRVRRRRRRGRLRPRGEMPNRGGGRQGRQPPRQPQRSLRVARNRPAVDRRQGPLDLPRVDRPREHRLGATIVGDDDDAGPGREGGEPRRGQLFRRLQPRGAPGGCAAIDAERSSKTTTVFSARPGGAIASRPSAAAAATTTSRLRKSESKCSSRRSQVESW